VTRAPVDERHACPGLVWIDSDAHPCGLWWRHDGEHVPFVGDYLPPPLLHPLDARLVPIRARETGTACPNGHGGRWFEPFPGRRWWIEPSYQVEATTALRHFVDGHWLAPQTELEWRFEPCGCTFREIVTAPDVELN
jgi:hypothetical protein